MASSLESVAILAASSESSGQDEPWDVGLMKENLGPDDELNPSQNDTVGCNILYPLPRFHGLCGMRHRVFTDQKEDEDLEDGDLPPLSLNKSVKLSQHEKEFEFRPDVVSPEIEIFSAQRVEVPMLVSETGENENVVNEQTHVENVFANSPPCGVSHDDEDSSNNDVDESSHNDFNADDNHCKITPISDESPAHQVDKDDRHNISEINNEVRNEDIITVEDFGKHNAVDEQSSGPTETSLCNIAKELTDVLVGVLCCKA